MCQFDAPDFAANGTGEGAFLMPEQFALQKAGGDRGAVNFDERSILEAAHAMYSMGHQFFPRAGFPQNQHGRLTGRDRCDLVEYLPKCSTVSNDLRKLPFGPCVSLKVASLLSQPLLEQVDFSRGAAVFDSYGQLVCHLID